MRAATILTALLLTTPAALAQKRPSVHEFVGVFLRACDEIAAINDAMLMVDRKERMMLEHLEAMGDTLEQRPDPLLEAMKLQRRIDATREALTQARAREDSAVDLEMLAFEIKLLERHMALLEVEDDAARQRKIEAIGAEIALVRNKAQQRRGEIEQRHAKLQSKYRPYKFPLQRTEIMKFIGQPRKPVRTRARGKTMLSERAIEIRWTDPDRKIVALAMIYFSDPDEKPDYRTVDLIDHKHPAEYISNDRIIVHPGPNRVMIRTDHPELREPGVLRGRLGEFLDLDGIAKIKPIVHDQMPDDWNSNNTEPDEEEDDD